jgi:nucleotide-binding universal stress UspA family protein
MARAAGSTVRLLHVDPVPDTVEQPDGRVIAYADQEMARLEHEGMDYLQGLEADLEGVPVECVVRFGHPVAEILVEAEAWGADLIALTGRPARRIRRLLGRRGLSGRIVRTADAAVLVYRPGRTAD